MGAQRDQKAITAGQEFYGLVTAMDPHDLPALAARKAVNTQVNREGSLQVRPGMKQVTFEDVC